MWFYSSILVLFIFSTPAAQFICNMCACVLCLDVAANSLILSLLFFSIHVHLSLSIWKNNSTLIVNVTVRVCVDGNKTVPNDFNNENVPLTMKADTFVCSLAV